MAVVVVVVGSGLLLSPAGGAVVGGGSIMIAFFFSLLANSLSSVVVDAVTTGRMVGGSGLVLLLLLLEDNDDFIVVVVVSFLFSLSGCTPTTTIPWNVVLFIGPLPRDSAGDSGNGNAVDDNVDDSLLFFFLSPSSWSVLDKSSFDSFMLSSFYRVIKECASILMVILGVERQLHYHGPSSRSKKKVGRNFQVPRLFL